MGRLIDIAWPQLNIKVVAELNDERNPELCEEFWQQLPFVVTQAHPVVSGASMYAWTPIVSSAPVHHRELITECPVGRLRYSQLTGNKMSVQYGKGQEPLAQPVLGQVLPEYCDLLPGVGKAVWNNLFFEKGVIFLEVSPHEGQGHPGRPATVSNLHPVAKKLIEEADRIQLIEPEEIRALRLGEIEDAGTYGQYFSAWDFANGMIRDYIMYTIYPILTLVEKMELKDLSLVLNTLDMPYSDYLVVVGFKKLQIFAGEMRDAVAKAESREEVEQILRAFLKYGNRLCAWSYQMFPWYLGMFYNRSKDGQDRPGRWMAESQ